MDVPVGRDVVLHEDVGLGEALGERLGPVAGPARQVGAGVLGQPAALQGRDSTDT